MVKKNKKKLQKSFTLNKKKLKNIILSLFYEEPDKTLNYKQVSSWLGIKDSQSRNLVNLALQELKDDDYYRLFAILLRNINGVENFIDNVLAGALSRSCAN